MPPADGAHFSFPSPEDHPMRSRWLLFLPLGLLTLALVGHSGSTTGQIPGPGPRKFPDFATVVKGAKEHDGLFKLYHKEDTLYAEIKPSQLEQPFLLPIAIA